MTQQIKFYYNHLAKVVSAIANGTMTFSPMNLYGSLSLVNFNMIVDGASASKTLSLSLGLYYLTGSTLSLENSISISFSHGSSNFRGFITANTASKTQNMTPGTWWWGILASTAGTSWSYAMRETQLNMLNAANAFPGAFIGGVMTVSTNALPTSYETSNLGITGNNIVDPAIYITA